MGLLSAWAVGRVAPGAARSLVVWRRFEIDADGNVVFIQKLVGSSDGVEERTAAVELDRPVLERLLKR